jgi:hypothetical protein
MTATSKLPTDARAVIRDPDLAAAVEQLLKPHSGKKLEAAQAAVRQVRASGVVGTFTAMRTAYQDAIAKAIKAIDE